MTSRVLLEPTSPFVFADRTAMRLPAIEDRPHPILFDLLAAPERVVDRLLEPAELERTLLASLVAIALGQSCFAVVWMLPFGIGAAIRAAILAGTSSLIGIAAALGPIWAAGLLVSARLPLARLVGTMLTSSATGALILAALAPIPHLLQRWDALWAGPLAMVFCFAFASIASGARIHRTLLLLAERIARTRSNEPLNPSERDRVGILARIAMVMLAFTGALAVWGFDAFAF
jgi:hypothetical protein